jgi:outer membrane protein assembly factor BamB
MLAALILVAVSVPQDRIDFPKVSWHLPVALGVPTVADGTVYAGGYGLFRIDGASGEILAEVGRVEPGDGVNLVYTGAPTVTKDRVVARKVDGGAVAFDLQLAETLWTWDGEGEGWAHAGVLVEGTYFFSNGWYVVALDIADGSERWKRALSGNVAMTPAVSDGLVFVGTEGGAFQALDAQTGEPVWTVEGFGSFGWTNPVARDGVVYVGDRGLDKGTKKAPFNSSTIGLTSSRSGALHAFDAKTGEQQWGRVFGATGLSDPFVTKKAVFAGFGKYVAQFDKKTGEIDANSMVRTGANAFGSPTVFGKRLYFGNLDGHLYAHRLKGGALEWAFAVPGAQVNDFVHTGSRIFVSTTKGLFALGPGKKGKGGSTLVWQGN